MKDVTAAWRWRQEQEAGKARRGRMAARQQRKRRRRFRRRCGAGDAVSVTAPASLACKLTTEAGCGASLGHALLLPAACPFFCRTDTTLPLPPRYPFPPPWVLSALGGREEGGGGCCLQVISLHDSSIPKQTSGHSRLSVQLLQEPGWDMDQDHGATTGNVNVDAAGRRWATTSPASPPTGSVAPFSRPPTPFVRCSATSGVVRGTPLLTLAFDLRTLARQRYYTRGGIQRLVPHTDRGGRHTTRGLHWRCATTAAGVCMPCRVYPPDYSAGGRLHDISAFGLRVGRYADINAGYLCFITSPPTSSFVGGPQHTRGATWVVPLAHLPSRRRSAIHHYY